MKRLIINILSCFIIDREKRSSFRRGLLNKHMPDRRNIEDAAIIAEPIIKCVIPVIPESEKFSPLVSVVVPNYNHEPYLRERLDSIYQQTYQNIEVLLLDDQSTDGSREILEEYQGRYPEITRCYFNDENSGNVFNQWEKGVREARGELIWIAESDDYCETGLLENLVPFFYDQAMMIAYCRSSFMQEGKEIWSIEAYLDEIDPELWHSPFVATAHEIINHSFTAKNIIPNGSSAIYRNTGDFSAFHDPCWKELKLCGDWLFYLHTMRGGKIGYSPRVTNFFRIHPQSTSLNIRKESRYLSEHELMASKAIELYDVKRSGIVENRRNMVKWYLNHYKGQDWETGDFVNQYSLEKIYSNRHKRKLHVLMCSYAMTPGGGETFPIFLANALKKKGYTVTFLDYNGLPAMQGVRLMLDASIPLLRLDNRDDLPNLINSCGADIIHSHYADVDYHIDVIKDQLFKCKHVVTLHGMYEAISERQVDLFLPVIEKGTDEFVYLSDKNLTEFKRKNFDLYNFTKLHNALERRPSSPIARDSMNIGEDDFVVCQVSRAIKEKGMWEAVKAVELAQEKSARKIHLILIGSGPCYDELKNLNHPNIHVLGFKGNPRDYFAMSDMGILPTYYSGESFPLVFIECILSGKPILTTNIGEFKNQLTLDTGQIAGCLIDLVNGCPDVESFARQIALYANDPEQYAKLLEIVEQAMPRFDIDLLVDRYIEVYERAILRKIA